MKVCQFEEPTGKVCENESTTVPLLKPDPFLPENFWGHWILAAKFKAVSVLYGFGQLMVSVFKSGRRGQRIDSGVKN